MVWTSVTLAFRPSISSHSKPCMIARTRLLIFFVLQHSVIKTKHLRSLVRDVVQGFKWVEILGFNLKNRSIASWKKYHPIMHLNSTYHRKKEKKVQLKCQFFLRFEQSHKSYLWKFFLSTGGWKKLASIKTRKYH